MLIQEKIILASSSPRRADLLRQVGIDFEMIKIDVEEYEPLKLEHLTPEQIVQDNACRKGRVVSEIYPARLVLAADTSVFLDEHVLNKPSDMSDAVRMLEQLAGRTHEVWTGVYLGQKSKGYEEDYAVRTAVTFKPLTRAQIARYFGLVNPLDKAGAYGFQEYGEMIVSSFDGPESNIIGLPIESVLTRLLKIRDNQI